MGNCSEAGTYASLVKSTPMYGRGKAPGRKMTPVDKADALARACTRQ